MADWQERLIAIYVFVCKHYQQDLKFYVERRSNNSDLKFSDEEAIALYLFGISDRKEQLIAIYEYADRHLRNWFPALPSYVAFVQRLIGACVWAIGRGFIFLELFANELLIHV